MPRLAGMSLPSGSDTVVYTSPIGQRSTVSVNLTNISQGSTFINLGLCGPTSTSLQPGDYLEYNTPLPPGNTLERNSLAPWNGECIIAHASDVGVSILVWGYEEGST